MSVSPGSLVCSGPVCSGVGVVDVVLLGGVDELLELLGETETLDDGAGAGSSFEQPASSTREATAASTARAGFLFTLEP
ncbi:MAG: hypothetical protein QM809_03955 [Gordonia sp. (in: high G+C Gram-positive bacteria)]|uniref:hypothetical protein n=1 Tax=Gordonia sp. (in: high G+C Gram-positive bacteria) TaxID=84139 RepID=UPI0039E4864C